MSIENLYWNVILEIEFFLLCVCVCVFFFFFKKKKDEPETKEIIATVTILSTDAIGQLREKDLEHSFDESITTMAEKHKRLVDVQTKVLTVQSLSHFFKISDMVVIHAHANQQGDLCVENGFGGLTLMICEDIKKALRSAQLPKIVYLSVCNSERIASVLRIGTYIYIYIYTYIYVNLEAYKCKQITNNPTNQPINQPTK
ncbi:hypothetical protein RFI_10942 [Reticulomyxa filosa]|uniref:Uncharacterized protein n=1 Tax=Reticulomyxa filosa TaxID=46433 RepID=X6NJV7_RETFI|nr:hypothetical protein RFI_10942 [Reticulomyxa filosa]|eukprot:ETO26198.1 hypothetical protein RFI_10942 [Reticulomyxa filosa]